MRDLISSSPVLAFGAGELITLLLSPLSLPDGSLIGSYSNFRVALREDPEWPRKNSYDPALKQVDPLGDNWAIIATGTGSINSDDIPQLTFTMPIAAGTNRYALDVWATKNGNDVQLVRPTWVTCIGRVVALS